MEFTSDQGGFSAPVPEGRETESLNLDGKRARMRTVTNGSQGTGFGSYTQIHFPDIGTPMPI